jgi:hypothetical protein
MGISQKAVYITYLFTKKARIIHRDVTAPGKHIPERAKRGQYRPDFVAPSFSFRELLQK